MLNKQIAGELGTACRRFENEITRGVLRVHAGAATYRHLGASVAASAAFWTNHSAHFAASATSA